MSVHDFDQTVHQIANLARSGGNVNPIDFYPIRRSHKGVSRDLPLVDDDLVRALSDYLEIRLKACPDLKKTDPLFLSQKGTPYSPNSLQQHMGKMLKQWALIEKASSHSGRRSLATNIIHNQGQSLGVVQKNIGA